MEQDFPKTTLPGLVIAFAAIGAAALWWIATPFEQESDLLVAGIVVAFVVALVTWLEVFLSAFVGALFIGVCLAKFIPQDPSGLAPPEFTIPLALLIDSGPMIAAAWFGFKLRRWLDQRDTIVPVADRQNQ